MILAATLASLSAHIALAAQPPVDASQSRLNQLEREMKQGETERDEIRRKADALAKELAEIKTGMVAAARAVQEHEDALSDLESQLEDLNQVEREKKAALDLKRQQLNGVLTALQRLAFRPSEALIAQPTSPADTVRSAILLRDVAPRIHAEADSLKAELDSLAVLRQDVAHQQHRIAAMAAKLDGEHRRLSSLYERKERLQKDAEGKRQESETHLAALASEASDLRDLLTRIEEEKKRAEAEAQRRAEAERAQREAERAAAKAAAKAAHDAEIAARKAAYEAEIAARKAAKEKHEAELAQARQAKVAEAKAREAAQIAAVKAEKAEKDALALERQGKPSATAHASFSHAQGEMPFPARGHILIKFGQIDTSGQPARGITIATRPDAQVIAPFDGQIVFAGPFRGYGLLLIIEHSEGYHTLLAGMARIDGVVGQHLVIGEPVAVMGPSDGKPLLYVELRHNGQPVNPLPWLTARKTRVSG